MSNDDDHSLSAEALEALLAQARPIVPFTRDELADLRLMRQEWNYAKETKARRKGWVPLMFTIISLALSGLGVAVSLIVNFVQSGKTH